MAEYVAARPSINTEPAPAKHYLDKYQTLVAERREYDRKWQLVSDYMLPRRDFTVAMRPNQLRPHRVTSSVATALGVRLAANILANAIDPTRPNLLPNVKRGLAMSGRNAGVDDDGLNYLGDLAFTINDRMLLPRAHLLERLGAIANEFVFFGAGVIFTGRKKGFGPVYNARPLQACWWSLDENDEVDTLYFKLKLPLYRVLKRWPKARELEGWKDDQRQDEMVLTDILIATEPRAGGVAGRVAEAKPFAYVCIAEEKGAILEESGYDSFPYAVFRNNPFPGAAYAEGQGCTALPDVMVMNHMQQAVENIAEQKGNPPLAWPARMFPKPLDRRPGAFNSYNPAGLGIARADQAILKLDMTGDPGDVLGHIEYLTKSLGGIFFEDWMKLRETGDMTAEEVADRRGLRSDGMASIVAHWGLPMTLIGDRSMEIAKAEGMLPPNVPASIAGMEVDWEYAGPLAIAQLRENVQATLQLINARGIVAEQSAADAEVIDLSACLRTIQAALATPMSTVNSQAKVIDARERAARAQLQEANANKIAALAGAAKDGGAAVASLAGAAPPPSPQAGAAPLAPAAPFAQPLAA